MQFTTEHRAALVDYLSTHNLPKGIGTKESACSIAAINLAINGKLTDDIPDCMSLALGRATRTLQDAMPENMRNSARYKALLPDMAGTGRDLEKERAGVLLEWMWATVLPQLQDVADARGFGGKWRAMCAQRTPAAARTAADAANAARAAYAARAAAATAYAARAAAADAADAAADAAAAARAAAYAADADAADAFWEKVDPISALERATYIK